MNKQRFTGRLSAAITWVLFSPGGWVVMALLLFAALGIAHSLNWRAYTIIFSGTLPAPTPGKSSETLATLGLLYASLYFIAVLIAPILILAAAMRWVVERVFMRMTP